MRFEKLYRSFLALIVISFSLAVFTGCDSGKETIDTVTGNRAVKQFHKSEEDIKDIVDQQSQRFGSIPEDEEDEDVEE